MKAVIFIDVQNDFIDGALPADKDRKITQMIGSYALSQKKVHVPLVATRDTHNEDYMQTLEGEKLPVKHCIAGTRGWQIANELKDFIPEDNIIDKTTFGSIDDLVARMQDICDNAKGIFGEDIDEFEICGFCASICVISNALILRAAFPNTKIIILENLCGDINNESKKAAFLIAKNCQIDVATTII